MALKMKFDDRQSDEEILSQYSPKDMKAAVQSKIDSKGKILEAHFGGSKKQLVLAAAAVFALLFIAPVTVSQIQKRNGSAIDEARVKGSASKNTVTAKQQLIVYRYESGNAIALKNGTKVSEGDLIQICYAVPHAMYGMIISIDGNGTITQHYPQDKEEAVLLSSDKDAVPLTDSYQLDDAPAYERFIFVTSDKPFTMRALEIGVSKMNRKQAEKDSLKEFLPKDATINSIVLRKDSK